MQSHARMSFAESRQRSTIGHRFGEGEVPSLGRSALPLSTEGTKEGGAGGCEKDYYGAALENLLVLLKRTKTFSLDFFSKSLFTPPLVPRITDSCSEAETVI